MLDEVVEKWIIIVLVAFTISTGLASQFVMPEGQRRVLAVFAYACAGTAFIVSQV